jgi:hypothetical protein
MKIMADRDKTLDVRAQLERSIEGVRFLGPVKCFTGNVIPIIDIHNGIARVRSWIREEAREKAREIVTGESTSGPRF